MHPIILSIGRFTIASYSLMIALGFLAALLLTRRRSVRFSLYDCFFSILMALVSAGICGKLLYIIIEHRAVAECFMEYPLEQALEMVLSGGFVLYGGLFGIVIGLWFASHENHLDFRTLLDAMAPSASLAIAFGRIGCLLGGCCYGRPYDGPLAITYPEGSYAPSGIPLFPSPIAESLGALIITAVLLIYERKKDRRLNSMLLLFLLYAPLRFILEFFRGDSARGMIGRLSTSQAISIAMVAAIAAYLGKRKTRS